MQLLTLVIPVVPLINADGELIGINSSKISKEGIEGMGFAIPINSAMTIVDSIIKMVRSFVRISACGPWIVKRQLEIM